MIFGCNGGMVRITAACFSVAAVLVAGCTSERAAGPSPTRSAWPEPARFAATDTRGVDHVARKAPLPQVPYPDIPTAARSATGAENGRIPPVRLTAGHQRRCAVGVGETLPPLSLSQLDGALAAIPELLGERATVLIFWHADRMMSGMQLADLSRDVVPKYGHQGVEFIGVAVEEPVGAVLSAAANSHADLHQLLDTSGAAFAQLGTGKLPRTYVLGPDGKIVWFDIEYSQATRRELETTLEVLARPPLGGS